MTIDTQNFMQWPRTMEESEGRVLYALRSYQIIETALKAYLCRFPQYESSCEDASTSTKKNVQNMPLGSLLKEFESINTNQALYEMLKAIKDERNEIAHQALVTQKDGIAKILGVEVMDIKRLRAIDRRASKAMAELVCEFLKTSSKDNEK